MNNAEALQLAKQGFTAEEIRALGWSAEGTDEGAGKDKENEKHETTTEIKTEPKEETGTEVNTDLAAMVSNMQSAIEGLNSTVKAIQEHNQKTATNPDSGNRPKSADDVIKGFIENM